MNSVINVYTDGSLVKRDGKIYCGYGIYFGNLEYKPISRKFTHEPITNNRAELYAILKTIILCNKINLQRIINEQIEIEKINIYSDSEYSVKTLTIWYKQWMKNKKEYLNADIIDEIMDHINNASFKIELIHINSHTNKLDEHSKGNDNADKLAKKGAFR